MHRTYEVMFIVRPDMLEEDLDKLISAGDERHHRRWHREDVERWASAAWRTSSASSRTASIFW